MKLRGKLSAYTKVAFLLSVLITLISFMACKGYAEPIYRVIIIGQLNICYGSNPCVMVTLKAHAEGDEASSLTGPLLIWPNPGARGRIGPACVADVTGSVTRGPAVTEATVTLSGTLHGPLRALTNFPCAGDLQDTPVILSGNNFDGSITLTTENPITSAVVTLGESKGMVIIQLPPQVD